MSVLAVEEISKSFRGLKAVAQASFDVPAGAIVALIGPNGAGKTTCFNMIAGVFAPDCGKHRLRRQADPRPAARPGLRRGHRPHLPDRQALRRAVGARQRDGRRACSRRTNVAGARRASPLTILEKLGLRPKRDLPASSLTLPDRKRLEVARALATRPKLLLLDEVMAACARPSATRWSEVFRDLNRADGLTILLIEHVMRAVMALAQQIVVLHHGEVIARGAPAEVVRDPAVLECYLGEETEV